MMHHDETAALLPAAHQSSKRDNCCVRLIRIFPLLTSMLLAMFFYIAYFTFHLLHFLNLPRTDSRFYWGLFQTISYNALFCLFFISLILCWLVHPGRIPDSAPWIWPPLDKETQSQLPLRLETKAQSENRYCVICQRWKPDRAHHCRACGVCVLKMDHHCPWVNNCVGFRNYKYFYLCVWYAQWGLSFQCATSIESLLRLLKDTQSQFISVFAAYCNVCLAGLGAFLLGILLCFHSLWVHISRMIQSD
ncbi:MAG: uncharacterized protein KVP18_002918 [Porospora cf. gigantea A]|uniref:uncharacterized protein n=1 Tax=Porospora cf. gigantea A TaxID=2853593 RepID=UPI003559C888|nr:MAG: hypothetical protein KVP18_002918 [Porospora cf. gigantea A]